jgi:hypothetical protein
MATRATLYAVTDKDVVSSVEFNGDGYPEGYGVFYIHLLEKARDLDDFIQMVQEFQQCYFRRHSDSDLFSFNKRSKYFKKGFMTMKKDEYFDNYYSDWIFIKNLSKKAFGIVTRDGNLKVLNTGEQIALHFGSSEGSFKTADECRRIHDLFEREWGIVGENRKHIIESSGQTYIQ